MHVSQIQERPAFKDPLTNTCTTTPTDVARQLGLPPTQSVPPWRHDPPSVAGPRGVHVAPKLGRCNQTPPAPRSSHFQRQAPTLGSLGIDHLPKGACFGSRPGSANLRCAGIACALSAIHGESELGCGVQRARVLGGRWSWARSRLTIWWATIRFCLPTVHSSPWSVWESWQGALRIAGFFECRVGCFVPKLSQTGF
jgi:hypothetical protein